MSIYYFQIFSKIIRKAELKCKENDFISVNAKPVNEDIFKRGICLPSDIKMTAEEQQMVIAAVRELFEHV